MSTRAFVCRHEAMLSEDFGRTYAMRIFDMSEEELERIVGRYSRGKRVGKLRGSIAWWSVKSGGWLRGAGVVAPKTTAGHMIVDYHGETLYAPKFNFSCAAEAFKQRRVEREAAHNAH